MSLGGRLMMGQMVAGRAAGLVVLLGSAKRGTLAK